MLTRFGTLSPTVSAKPVFSFETIAKSLGVTAHKVKQVCEDSSAALIPEKGILEEYNQKKEDRLAGSEPCPGL